MNTELTSTRVMLLIKSYSFIFVLYMFDFAFANKRTVWFFNFLVFCNYLTKNKIKIQINGKCCNQNRRQHIRNNMYTQTHNQFNLSAAFIELVKNLVLERPSSQMSYLDHFLKESGSTTNTTHTTSSTIAVNMVRIQIAVN